MLPTKFMLSISVSAPKCFLRVYSCRKYPSFRTGKFLKQSTVNAPSVSLCVAFFTITIKKNFMSYLHILSLFMTSAHNINVIVLIDFVSSQT